MLTGCPTVYYSFSGPMENIALLSQYRTISKQSHWPDYANSEKFHLLPEKTNRTTKNDHYKNIQYLKLSSEMYSLESFGLHLDLCCAREDKEARKKTPEHPPAARACGCKPTETLGVPIRKCNRRRLHTDQNPQTAHRQMLPLAAHTGGCEPTKTLRLKTFCFHRLHARMVAICKYRLCDHRLHARVITVRQC